MHNLEPDNSKDNIKHPDFNNNNINNINRNIKNYDTNNNVQHLNFNNNNNNILNGDANNNIFNNIRENNINRNTNHINKINVNRNINQVNNNINLGNKNTNSFEKQVTNLYYILYICNVYSAFSQEICLNENICNNDQQIRKSSIFCLRTKKFRP